MSCDAGEVQAIKDALSRDANNMGVGILHEPTGQIRLAPFDQVGGHKGLARKLNWPEQECKGFVVGKRSDGTFLPMNVSELNGPPGQPGALLMPPATFQEIVQQLTDTGL